MSHSVKSRTLGAGVPRRRLARRHYPPRPRLCWSVAMPVDHAQLDRDHLWHPFTQQQGWVEEEPLMIERAEGTNLDRQRGPPLHRRRLLALVQRPRPPPPGDRRGGARAARQGRPLDHARPLPPRRGRAGRAPGRARAARALARLLLGVGLDRDRDRAEDGLPVPAAARRPARRAAPPSSTCATPTTATRSARSRSAASTSSTPPTARCCSRPTPPSPATRPTSSGSSPATRRRSPR